MTEALGILEVTGFTPAMVALDAMTKAAEVRVLQAELNDFLGVVIKVVGSTAAVAESVAAGHDIADRMQGRPVSTVLNRPDQRAMQAIESRREVSPLIQQDVVLFPRPLEQPTGDQSADQQEPVDQKEPTVAEANHQALGFIETQGFTAVFEAIDSACKAANVEVLAKEKLGGGYVTVVVRGDVAAVKAAIDAGRSKVEGLGKLIAAHVIARPSQQVLSLLPK